MNATTSATTEDLMIELGRNARAAARVLAQSPSEAKNRALAAAAAAVRAGRQSILAANAQDMAAAQSKGLAKALLDRLMLDDKRVEAMAKGLEEVALLPSPLPPGWPGSPDRMAQGLDLGRSSSSSSSSSCSIPRVGGQGLPRRLDTLFPQPSTIKPWG